jgi:hypothetical protein
MMLARFPNLISRLAPVTPFTLSLSPSDGERVTEGRVRGLWCFAFPNLLLRRDALLIRRLQDSLSLSSASIPKGFDHPARGWEERPTPGHPANDLQL